MFTRRLLTMMVIGLSVLIVQQVRADSDGNAVVVKKKGTITGVIRTKDGHPLADGQILFFNVAGGPLPDPGKYDRTPDIIRGLDASGAFSVEVPAGSYFLGASKKASGEAVGPPKEGDYVWRSLDDQGRLKAYDIPAGGRVDIGTISGAIVLKDDAVLHRSVRTAIEGVVVDMDGNPVPDAVVVAFTSPSIKGKPKFISEKTDKDGKYVLRIAPGTYYLRARNEFASGPPEPGQIVGYYGEGTPASVEIKAGEVRKDINFRVILFPGRGPFSGGQ
jgi:hypothetical protein